MSRLGFRSTISAAMIAATAWLVPTAAFSQATDAAHSKAWQPARTPDGQPDIRGYWEERNNITSYSIETGRDPSHTKMTGQELDEIRSGKGRPIAEPADHMIPYQPWAKAVQQELIRNHMKPSKPEFLDPVVRGFLNGVPRINYAGPSSLQIMQTPGYVVFQYEYHHAYRVIPIDGRPHLPSDIKLWMGDSRGHWEGNTLVVDVTNNNDQTWFDVIGDFHSDALHSIERWTFVDADHIDYSITLEDAKAFTMPMKMAFTFHRNKEQGFEQIETAVPEGNKTPDIVFGAGATR